jgi:AAA15 family ATPase/GTPase
MIKINQRVDSSNISICNYEKENFKLLNLDEISEELDVPKSTLVREDIFIDDLSTGIEKFQIRFIPFGNSYSDFITNFYGSYLGKDKVAKARFFESLNSLFPEIERLEPSPGYYANSLALDVERKNERYSVPLAFYGEGLIKLVNVLAVISFFEGKRVMIDEIDTGIHHSRMKDFWKTILLAAKESDVQLFATTHNLECIRYFKEALEEVELVHLQKAARSITLVENSKTKDITAHTFSFEALEHSIDAGNEIRSF